ncbi:glucose-6-phosphate isomerase [bacterium endosymbiont of Pedicinus badii]|uniref:glucose-6-phosphate isomerase n=1 Tax=bacterium endosymbiont of Pedicinus badii TaxID=1719126 RepID=UPI0009BBA852|nr:glucose-6-phosphate isomerase [bacterium endosymbiont of Pedicinus badii]OQM34133.1 glucose-6-phosphate isomerase [bacterium endosymbiont of Pedicinus badii]
MKNINPKTTNAWKKLEAHYESIKNTKIIELFKKDLNRFKNFSKVFNNTILVDFSKNIITKKTIELLIQLAKECYLKEAILSMFKGEKINLTEKKSVLHVSLRKRELKNSLFNNKKISKKVQKSLEKIKLFCKDIICGNRKGYTGKRITDVVNIGIGGSEMGPKMVIDALKNYKNHLNIHFVSNIDGKNVLEVVKKINPESTIFLISSKTFSTKETIVNAETIKSWFLNHAKKKENMKMHFFAISNNFESVKSFGIEKKNFFKIWNWVGGRYSVWSSIGLSVALSIGFENFESFLLGANHIDEHFYSTDYCNNIPVLLALIGIWYNNFFSFETEAILFYDYNMEYFIQFIQQVCMESNGKFIDRNGKIVDYQTGNIIWGGIGTNCQHSFFQLMHQGTRRIPCDFIISIKEKNSIKLHHNMLLANFLAQTKVLAFGEEYKKEEYVYKKVRGNNPSNSILLKEINPYNLGSLIAIYEHKIFVQGVILNICSFDQWGVELGKKIAEKMLINFKKKTSGDEYDSSTNGLIKFCRDFI